MKQHGLHRSEYFATLFAGDFAELQDNTSHIKLKKLVADVFPLFLDYMYDNSMGGQETPFTTDNATALYSLAKYFGVRRLENEVKKYVDKTCSIKISAERTMSIPQSFKRRAS
jgi:BTB/POZ domain